jgi:hypothetical protein
LFDSRLFELISQHCLRCLGQLGCSYLRETYDQDKSIFGEKVKVFSTRFQMFSAASYTPQDLKMRTMSRLLVLLIAGVVGNCADYSFSDIAATGFFSGTIERFDETTGAQSTLSAVASAADPFPGLAGIAFAEPTNTLFASARISNRIYSVDAASGAVKGFHQLADGTSPAGLAVDGSGNLYVANSGGNTVSVFDSLFDLVKTITLPNVGVGDNLPSGVAVETSGDVLISTFAGAGVFRYDSATGIVSSLAPSPLSNNQIAIDELGNFVVGGAAFTNDVRRYAADGTEVGSPFLTIDATILPQPGSPYASQDFTSPSGVAYDANGNLIVAALGRTNPTSADDNFQNNGGLFRFAADGTLDTTFVTGSTPFSSVVVFTAVPEPTSTGILALSLGMAMFKRRRRTVN